MRLVQRVSVRPSQAIQEAVLVDQVPLGTVIDAAQSYWGTEPNQDPFPNLPSPVSLRASSGNRMEVQDCPRGQWICRVTKVFLLGIGSKVLSWSDC